MGSLVTGLCTLAGTLSGSYFTYYLDRKKSIEINFQQKKLECYTLINKIPFLLIFRYVRCRNIITEGKDLILPAEEDPIEIFSRIEFIILENFNFLFENFNKCKSKFIDFNFFLTSNITNPQTTEEILETEFTSFMKEIGISVIDLKKALINANKFEKRSKPNFWILKDKMSKYISEFFSNPNK